MRLKEKDSKRGHHAYTGDPGPGAFVQLDDSDKGKRSVRLKDNEVPVVKDKRSGDDDKKAVVKPRDEDFVDSFESKLVQMQLATSLSDAQRAYIASLDEGSFV